MLIGQYYTKIDNKGRTALPANLRRELGKELIVCRWYEGCLGVFSEKAWERVIDIAVGESLQIAPTRDTERFLLGGAFEIETDGQGRIILPQVLREYAGLKEEVVFLGLQTRVEVWSKETWVKREEEITKGAGVLIEEIQRLKLENAKRQ